MTSELYHWAVRVRVEAFLTCICELAHGVVSDVCSVGSKGTLFSSSAHCRSHRTTILAFRRRTHTRSHARLTCMQHDCRADSAFSLPLHPPNLFFPAAVEAGTPLLLHVPAPAHAKCSNILTFRRRAHTHVHTQTCAHACRIRAQHTYIFMVRSFQT